MTGWGYLCTRKIRLLMRVSVCWSSQTSSWPLANIIISSNYLASRLECFLTMTVSRGVCCM